MGAARRPSLGPHATPAGPRAAIMITDRLPTGGGTLPSVAHTRPGPAQSRFRGTRGTRSHRLLASLSHPLMQDGNTALHGLRWLLKGGADLRVFGTL